MLHKMSFYLVLATMLLAPGVVYAGKAQSANSAGAAASVSQKPKLTKSQKKELYTKGLITDSEGNVWSVLPIPGTKKIKGIARDGWIDAGHIFKDTLKFSKKTFLLLTKKTYYTKTLKGIANDGVHGVKGGKRAMKTTLNFAKSAFTRDLIKGIHNDWRTAGHRNSIAANDRSIGWQFQIVKNTSGAIFKTLGRTIYVPVKAAAGTVGIASSAGWTAGSAAYIVAGPGVFLVGTPVVAAVAPEAGAIVASGEILTKGMVAPGAMFAWNWSSWEASKGGRVPTHTTYWIALKQSGEDKPHSVLVDRSAFTSIVQAAVMQNLTDAQLAEIHKNAGALMQQQVEIQRQYMALNEQIRNKDYEARQKSNELFNSNAMQETNRLRRESSNRNATMKVADEVSALAIDDTALSQLVRDMAQAQNAKLTEEQVDEIVKKIRSEMETLAKKER
jgi:hypothetical protein